MDFGYFVNILLRRKWLILSVVILAAAAAWFFVGKLPNIYKSSATISAGIIEFKGLTLSKEIAFIQQFQVESQFNQLINDMTSRKSIRLLTNKLLEHDLIGEVPFREPDLESANLTKSQLDNFALVLQTHLDTVAMTPDFEKQNKDLALAFGYDYENLMEDLEVKREGDTDYISVSFESESPELSFFVVDTYCREFMEFFKNVVTKEEDDKVKFYTDLVDKKKGALDIKVREINDYKRQNALIDVETQSESVISTIKDYEEKIEEERKKIPALRSSIAILEDKIFKYNRSFSATYAEGLYEREDFVDIDKEIKSLRNQILDGGGNERMLDQRIKKLESRKAELIAQYVNAKINDDHYIHSQVEEWIREKSQKEIELEFAKKSLESSKNELARLRGRAGKLQIDDAQLTKLESDKETLEEQYNQATSELESAILFAKSTENPLSIIEEAQMPEKPEPSHRAVISGFSGVAGGTLTSILIFLLALMDSTIQSPGQFTRRTGLPIIGFVNKIKEKRLDLKFLFHSDNPKKELNAFRESVRKLRSILEASGKKIFLFVSPKPGEGKSFLMVLLAYALSLNNRKVLVIDTNFRNNTLSNFKYTPFWNITGDGVRQLKSNLLESGDKSDPPKEGDDPTHPNIRNVDIIGNKGGNQSPSEVLAGKDFDRVMRNYGTNYDYIFLEAASMNQYSDAMELMRYVDKTIAVFSAESAIKNTDKETIEFLRHPNTKFLGGILNKVDLKNLG